MKNPNKYFLFHSQWYSWEETFTLWSAFSSSERMKNEAGGENKVFKN